MQEITFEDKLKIQTEVADIIKDAHGRAREILSAFVTLKYCEKDLQKFYIEAFEEYLSENDLAKIISEIALNEYSYGFWVDAILEDIEYYKNPNKETDRHNSKKAYENKLKYAFYCYIDAIMSEDNDATKELLVAILEDYRYEFLHEIALIKLQELQYIKENRIKTDENPEEIYKSILEIDFEPSLVLFASKLEENKPAAQEQNEIISDDNTKKELQHEVQKISKENKKIVSSRTFDSKDEANNYIAGLQKEFPDLMRIFDFKIVEKK